MTNSFLDYYKTVLDKVSFDPGLLRKEYQKAKRNLQSDEIGDLNHWVKLRKLPVEISEGSHSSLGN